jgi:hypothetical protein
VEQVKWIPPVEVMQVLRDLMEEVLAIFNTH